MSEPRAFERILASLYDAMLDDARLHGHPSLRYARRSIGITGSNTIAIPDIECVTMCDVTLCFFVYNNLQP